MDEFWVYYVTYYKAVLVSILASLIDMGVMYGLDKSKWNEKIVVGLSSFAGLIIQFFGQKLWTFKNKTNSNQALLKQVLLFFGLELFIILCVVLSYGKIYEPIKINIKKALKGKKGISKLIFAKNKVELSTIFKILLKSIITFLTFNIISYPLWSYFIFSNDR